MITKNMSFKIGDNSGGLFAKFVAVSRKKGEEIAVGDIIVVVLLTVNKNSPDLKVIKGEFYRALILHLKKDGAPGLYSSKYNHNYITLISKISSMDNPKPIATRINVPFPVKLSIEYPHFFGIAKTLV